MSGIEDPHMELREALRALCAEFPDEYHRKHDQHATYPEEFLEALTSAGWLAAMIPEVDGLSLSRLQGAWLSS